MARKTKAELAAEAAAYQASLLADTVAKYPTMLLDALERATKLGYVLTVKETQFHVRDTNSNARWAMTPLYTKDSQETLEVLVWDLETEEVERAERDRKYQLKQSALSKLSKEERELLGL